jgi:hypothetical protein
MALLPPTVIFAKTVYAIEANILLPKIIMPYYHQDFIAQQSIRRELRVSLFH